MAQCAVEKYCERWFTPELRNVLITPNTDFWSEHDVRIVITGDTRDLQVKFNGGWYNPRLSGTLEIFTEPGEFLLSGLEANPFQAILSMVCSQSLIEFR